MKRCTSTGANSMDSKPSRASANSRAGSSSPSGAARLTACGSPGSPSRRRAGKRTCTSACARSPHFPYDSGGIVQAGSREAASRDVRLSCPRSAADCRAGATLCDRLLSGGGRSAVGHAALAAAAPWHAVPTDGALCRARRSGRLDRNSAGHRSHAWITADPCRAQALRNQDRPGLPVSRTGRMVPWIVRSLLRSGSCPLVVHRLALRSDRPNTGAVPPRPRPRNCLAIDAPHGDDRTAGVSDYCSDLLPVSAELRWVSFRVRAFSPGWHWDQ